MGIKPLWLHFGQTEEMAAALSKFSAKGSPEPATPL